MSDFYQNLLKNSQTHIYVLPCIYINVMELTKPKKKTIVFRSVLCSTVATYFCELRLLRTMRVLSISRACFYGFQNRHKNGPA